MEKMIAFIRLEETTVPPYDSQQMFEVISAVLTATQCFGSR